MSIRHAVYDLLNDLEADVYPMVAPQETTDAYVVYSMRRSPVRSQDGIGVQDVDLTLNIYANSLSACIELADTMYQGLEAATGGYGSGSSSETLHIANWAGEDGLYLDDLEKYMITQEYQLRFI